MHTALVTGGTDGIGRAIALRLAANTEHRVIVAGRDMTKGLACVSCLQRETGNAAVEFVQADLGTIHGADALVAAILSRVSSLTYLVHSAGTITKQRTLTTDGYEVMFATNFLSCFVLTERLWWALERGGRLEHPARVLFVSGGARGGALHYDQIPNAPRYRLPTVVRQYALANDLYALHAWDRSRDSGAPIEVRCLKLGPVKTSLRRNFPRWMKVLSTLVLDPLVGQTPEDAANAALVLLEGHAFGDHRDVLFTKIRKLKPLDATGQLADPDARRQLAEWAERLVTLARHRSVTPN